MFILNNKTIQNLYYGDKPVIQAYQNNKLVYQKLSEEFKVVKSKEDENIITIFNKDISFNAFVSYKEGDSAQILKGDNCKCTRTSLSDNSPIIMFREQSIYSDTDRWTRFFWVTNDKSFIEDKYTNYPSYQPGMSLGYFSEETDYPIYCYYLDWAVADNNTDTVKAEFKINGITYQQATNEGTYEDYTEGRIIKPYWTDENWGKIYGALAKYLYELQQPISK